MERRFGAHRLLQIRTGSSARSADRRMASGDLESGFSRRCCGWFRRRRSSSTTALAGPGRSGTPPNTGCEPLKGSRASWRSSTRSPGGLPWRPGDSGRSRRRTRSIGKPASIGSCCPISPHSNAISCRRDMSRPDAQGLIGRSIFTQYLIDRRIVTTRHLAGVYGHGTLAAILRDRRATKRLFDRLREVFNGDMFPSEGASVPRAGHLRRVADFLEAVDPDTGTNDVLSVPVRRDTGGVDQFDLRTVRPIGPAGPRR